MDYNHPSPTSLALELFLVLSVMLRTLPPINVRARLESIAFPESLLRGASHSEKGAQGPLRELSLHSTLYKIEKVSQDCI